MWTWTEKSIEYTGAIIVALSILSSLLSLHYTVYVIHFTFLTIFLGILSFLLILVSLKRIPFIPWEPKISFEEKEINGENKVVAKIEISPALHIRSRFKGNIYKIEIDHSRDLKIIEATYLDRDLRSIAQKIKGDTLKIEFKEPEKLNIDSKITIVAEKLDIPVTSSYMDVKIWYQIKLLFIPIAYMEEINVGS